MHAPQVNIALRAARQAGNLIRRAAESNDPLSVSKKGMNDFVTEVDRAAEQRIIEVILKAYPDHSILAEESGEIRGKGDGADFQWVIDPLDGTREFGEPQRTDWAVHVALAEHGLPTAGAVALPGLDLTLSTPDPPDASSLPPVPPAPRVVVSRTRPPAEALAVAGALDGVLVEMGSAGAKAMAVVRGEADVYVHSGGQYEWDNCAPAAVAAAAGLHVSRIDGSPLTYNHADPYLPDLVICRAELADVVLSTLSRPGHHS